MCVLQKQTKSTMQDISSQRKLTVMSESEEDNSRIHELWQRGAQHSKHLYHEYTTLVLINIHIGNIMLSRVFLRNNKRRQQQMIFVHWEPAPLLSFGILYFSTCIYIYIYIYQENNTLVKYIFKMCKP